MAAPSPYFAVALDEIKEDLRRRGAEIFDFGVGDPVEPTPSFIRQALIDALDPISQYPTGASIDLHYLLEQVAVAQEYDILLCGDDCYLDLYFSEDAPPPALLQVSQSGVLSVGSLSKRSGMTGYRSGYIAGDPSVIALLKRARPNFGVASPNFVQAA